MEQIQKFKPPDLPRKPHFLGILSLENTSTGATIFRFEPRTRPQDRLIPQ